MATFVSTHYDEHFDGTARQDTLVLSGDASGYEISFVNGKVQIKDVDLSDGDTGIDTLGAIDILSFGDRDFLLSSQRETFVSSVSGPNSGHPAVMLLADGSYAVVWSDQDVRLQRYDEAGNAIGGTVRINTTTISTQHAPDITVLADGGFVVAWESYHSTTADIYMRRYDASGNAVGDETRVNTTTPSTQWNASTAALAGGGFVVNWTSEDGSGWGIYAQRFDAAGNAVGGETRVNATAVGTQYYSAIAAFDDGGYAIVWHGIDASGAGIFAQRFDAAGNAVGGETLVNTTTANQQYFPAIAALGDDGYVIAWTSHAQDGSGYGVYAQRFDAAGNAVGVETRVNSSTTGEQLSPAVTALTDGGYVVAWSGQGDGDVDGIYLQRYDAAGNAVGGESRVNDITTGLQTQADITALVDGGFVVTWNSAGVICSQRYNADGEPVFLEGMQLSGTGGDDLMNGGRGIQRLLGLDGNDTLYGRAGDDVLVGGLGVDFLSGGVGDDVFCFDRGLKNGANVDTITGFSVGEDVIRLENAVFARLVNVGTLGPGRFIANADGSAVDDNDFILYETDTGQLYYDRDGNGAGEKILFAVLGNKAALTAADFEVI